MAKRRAHETVTVAIQAAVTLMIALATAPVLRSVNAAIHDAFGHESVAREFQPHDARQNQADAAQPHRIARLAE